MCKKLSQLLPAGVAWCLIVGSTASFYALVAPRLIEDDIWGVSNNLHLFYQCTQTILLVSKTNDILVLSSIDVILVPLQFKAYFIIGIDVFLFLLVVSNLVMAMCLDPGIYPIGKSFPQFASPLFLR